MKLTIKTLYDLLSGLGDLIDKELPVTVSFRISRNHKKVLDELKTVEEQRKKLVDGGVKEKADKEFNKLLKEEVEIDLQELDINEFDVPVKPRTLTLLSTILKEDTNE